MPEPQSLEEAWAVLRPHLYADTDSSNLGQPSRCCQERARNLALAVLEEARRGMSVYGDDINGNLLRARIEHLGNE